MGLIILSVLLAIVTILIPYAMACKPNVVKITRTEVVQASPENVFPYINNARRIQEWNPFAEGDTSLQLSFAGPAEGPGAKWSWDGKKAGAGEATIVSSEPCRRVALRLDFERPFSVTNFGEYSLNPNGSTTEVTWQINETAMIPRVLSLFMPLDKMIGAQFEKGLQKLKTLVETGLN